MHTRKLLSNISFSHAKNVSHYPIITGFFLVFFAFFGILTPPGYSKEDSWNLTEEIVRLAKQGNAEAQFRLAQIYEEGRGLPHNPKKALFWLMRAAQQDLPVACLYLGMKFEFGNGVQQNTKVAGELYAKAAVHDWAMAQYLLAMLLLDDKSAEKRLTAMAWLKLASEQEYPQAKEKYLEMLKTLTKHEKSQLTARYEYVVRQVRKRSSMKN